MLVATYSVFFFSPAIMQSDGFEYLKENCPTICGRYPLWIENHNFIIASIEVPSEYEDENEEKKASVHFLSNKKVGLGMVNFPPQVTSSRSFLHLGNGFFAYLLSRMPLPARNNLEHDDKERVLSILIFQAFPGTYMEDHALAKFLYSVHYKINSAFSDQGGILGCFSV